MVYRKEYKIRGKIIKKEEIIYLINESLNKYKANKNKEDILLIDINFTDGTSIQDSSIEIFDNYYFDKKKIDKISIRSGKDHYDDNIRVYISGHTYGTIDVSCTDQVVFDSLCHSVETVLHDMKKQKVIYILADKVPGFLLLLLLFYIFDLIVFLLFKYVFKFDISYIILFIIILISSYVFAPVMVKWIDTCYPPLDYDFGDKSVNHPQMPNGFIFRIIAYLFTNIALPIILSFINK